MRAEIVDILSRVEYAYRPGYKSITWRHEDFARARQIAEQLEGYRYVKTSCVDCNILASFNVLNILRYAVKLDPVGPQASESLRRRRLSVCKGYSADHSDRCPAYDPDWNSCGRFVADAFSSEPVIDHDGTLIHPCGCNVGVKASFAAFSCPAGKWPSK